MSLPARGDAWVVAQVLLGAAVAGAAVGRTERSRPGSARRAAGVGLLMAGGALAAVSARRLGPALTPLPVPRPGAPLVTGGPYRWVRHPVYSGVLLLAAGAATAGSARAAAPAAALAALLDRKAAYEERRLGVAHPGYDDYARRVRWRLVPGLR